MLNSKETLQSNTSCYVDDNTDGILHSSAFYLSPAIQDKRFLLADLDSQGSILLENILKQLSEKLSQDEELPKIDLNHELLPIKIAISEMSIMTFEVINLNDSLSFSCLNNHLLNFSSFGCKNQNRKIQLCIDHYVLDNYLVSTSNVEETITCNSGDMKETLYDDIISHDMDNNLPIRVRKMLNTSYIIISLNVSMSSSTISRPSDTHVQYMSQSNLTNELYCCQLMLKETFLISHLHGVLYCSIFDKEKIFCAKIQMITEKTLSINQNFVFYAATFPIKSSGFDFYCRKNFIIREMSFRLEINSDMCSLTTHRSSSTDQDFFISNNVDFDKTILCSKNQCSPDKNKNIISLFKNNFSNDESFSSKCSVKSSHSQTVASFSENSSKSVLESVQSRSYNFRRTAMKQNANISEKIKKTFSSKYKCDYDNSLGTVTEIKSKYFPTEPINASKFSMSKAFQESPQNRSAKKRNSNCTMQNISPCGLLESIMNEIQPIIDGVIDKLTKSVVIDCWNMKLLSINRNFKSGPMSRSSLQTFCSVQSKSKSKASFQSFLLNRRNKLYNNKGGSCSFRETKPHFNQEFRNLNSKRRENKKSILIKGGSNICDLITSQSLFGQPPRSCIKSKYPNRTGIQQIRNLSWDLKKPNEKTPLQRKENINNNQFVTFNPENRPASIFDFAKARCLSADFPSKINLTNEQLIKASKQPFSYSGFIKSLHEGLLSRKSSRLSQKTYSSDFRRNFNRRRAQSSHIKNMRIPIANNPKYISRMASNTSNSTAMNRLKTDHRRNCIVNASNDRSQFTSIYNKHKGEASWNSNYSIGNYNNIFCFS